MRLGVVVLVVVGCGGSDGPGVVDAPPCQLDADCGAMYCTAGACTARPFWGAAAPIGGIASPGDEQDTATSPDDLELFFSSNRTGGPGLGGFDLWRATRVSIDAAFENPEPLDISSGNDERTGSLRADGLEFVFFKDTAQGTRIMRSARAATGGQFATPTEISELTIDSYEVSPSISADGLIIVFQASASPGSALRVFQAERTSTVAAFGTPHQLTELPTLDAGVGLAPDGRYLIGTMVDSFEHFVVFTRSSPMLPFASAGEINEIVGNPFVAGASVSGTGAQLYFSRPSDTPFRNELWAARRL